MFYVDLEKIKKVTFKVPDLVSEDAEQKVIDLYNSIRSLKDEISAIRMHAFDLEKDLEVLEKKWNTIKPLIDIEFETKEKEEVHQEINVGFNFSADINKHVH